MGKRDSAYLEKYLQKILNVDLLNNVNLLFNKNSKCDIRDKKDLILYVDEELEDYIEEKRSKIKTIMQQYDEEIKKKKDNLWHLERKYKKLTSNEEKEKLEESMLIEQIDIDELEKSIPDLKVQNIIGYVLNNYKVPILEFEYQGQTFKMQEFGEAKATIKILQSIS